MRVDGLLAPLREVRRSNLQSASPSVWARRAAAALSFGVPLWLLRTILGENRFSTLDYWDMMSQVYRADGSLRLRGFVEHQNDHLVVVPKILLVVNIELFHGSRVTLGVFVWLIAIALAVVVARAVGPLLPVGPWGRVGALWLLMLYVFPFSAQHNFRLAISGTAWTVSNLLLVLAVVNMARHRPIVAACLGSVATFTYATGLAAWPALIVVGVLVRRPLTWRIGVATAIGIVSIAVERLAPKPVGRNQVIERWPPTILRNLAVTIGELFTSGAATAALVGCVVLGLAVWAVYVLRQRLGDPGIAVLVGSLTAGLVSLLLIALSRGVLGVEAFGASRYMGVSALAVLFVSALVVIAAGSRPVVIAGLLALGVLSTMDSRETTAKLDGFDMRIARGEIAAYMGLGTRNVPLFRYAESAARAQGHIPFDGSFDLDCGLFGSTLISDVSVPGDGEVASFVGAPQRMINRGGQLVSGVVTAPELDCLVAIDETDRVVGIFRQGLAPAADTVAAAAAEGDDVTTLAGSGDGVEGVVLTDREGGLRLVGRVAGEDRFLLVGEVPEL